MQLQGYRVRWLVLPLASRRPRCARHGRSLPGGLDTVHEVEMDSRSRAVQLPQMAAGSAGRPLSRLCTRSSSTAALDHGSDAAQGPSTDLTCWNIPRRPHATADARSTLHDTARPVRWEGGARSRRLDIKDMCAAAPGPNTCSGAGGEQLDEFLWIHDAIGHAMCSVYA